MRLSLFLSFLFLLAEVNTRSDDTSEVRKSKEPALALHHPLYIPSFYEALVSFVYLGRQVTQFSALNGLLSNDSVVLKRYWSEARIPDKFAWCAIAIGIVFAESRPRAFTITGFCRGKCAPEKPRLVKRSRNFYTMYPSMTRDDW